MSGFPSGTVVDVQEINDQQWQLLKDISYQGKLDHFQVPVGQVTDFASVPRVFIWLLPRYGRYTKAAVLHDYLWEVQVPKGMSRLDADGLFRQAMRELGVSFLTRWMMWAAVRWAALFKADGRAGWWRDAPRVVAVTALGLPIALLPFIPILVSLLTFHILEWIFWVPLRVAHSVRRARNLPVKKVNTPRFTWSS